MQRLLVFWISIFFLSFSCSPSYAYAPYGRILCKNPGYTCVKVKNRQTWEKLFTDANQRMLVMQINRMNTPLYPGTIIAVPENLPSVMLKELSPFPAQIKSPGEKIIYVNPTMLAWAAYDPTGELVRWGPASLGSDWCRDLGHRCHSPVGDFHVYQKGSEGCRSTKFPLPRGGAPMPYCMFFKGGFALHGEPDGLPGDNVSHGCVRLFVHDAEWLSEDFVDPPNSKQKTLGTRVIVEPYGSFLKPKTVTVQDELPAS